MTDFIHAPMRAYACHPHTDNRVTNEQFAVVE